MPRWLLLTGAALLAGTLAAQEVEWESLDGPRGGHVPLVGTADGVAYRAFEGDVQRSFDGGLTWAGTGFSGSTIRALSVGHDGALLAAAADGAYRHDGEAWVAIGPPGAGALRVGSASDGTTYIWRAGCVVVRSSDLQEWEAFTLPGDPACHDLLVSPNGELLVIRRMWDFVLSFWVDHSVDGGQTWVSRHPGEHVQRLVFGQHGGIFAVAPPSDDGWGFRPPRSYRWTGVEWEVVATDHVTGLTTLPGGEIVFGYRHGFEDATLAGPLSRPLDIVLAADGSWLASTEWAGMWRRSASNEWHQVAGRPWTIDVLDRDQSGRLTAGFLGSIVHYDGEAWRHGLWTRGLVRGVAPLPDRTLLASPGYTGLGIEWNLDHGVGIWDLEADETIQISTECFGECLPNALIRVEEDVVIAGLGGEVVVCRPGDDRCAAGLPGGLFRSDDGGETWQASLTGFGNLCHLAAPGGGGVWAGAGLYHAADCPVAIYGYLPKAEGVFLSDDLGATWNQVGQALPGPYVAALAADGDGAAVALPTNDVYLIAADGTVEGIGGPGPAIRSVGISLNRAPLAGTDDGLFAFDSVNWRSLGLSGIEINVVRVEDDGMVYVATSQGVFRTTAPLVVSTEESAAPVASSLESVHPNPARGEVTATFRLAEAGTVEIAMYDLLGRRVAVLADGEYAAGPHAIRFGVGGVAAGVYVLELKAGGERWARRITVIDPF